HADPEIDHVAVLQFEGGPPGNNFQRLRSAHAWLASLGTGVDAWPGSTMASTYRWGVTMASGSNIPTGTISSTSATTQRAAVAMRGLKLRAVLRSEEH